MSQLAHLEYLSIRLDEKAGEVIAAFAPAGNVVGITPEEFKEVVEAAGFGECDLDDTAMMHAAEQYSAGDAFEIPVGKAIDGSFEIRMDASHLDAYLRCTPPVGGAPATLEQVLHEVRFKGIAAEPDVAAIENALLGDGDEVLIVKGRAAVDGEDGKFENLIPSAKERTPHLDVLGRADFRDLGEILTVRAGDRLMRRIPATAGEPGLTLTGKPIPAKPGKDVAFSTKLGGTKSDPSDANLLLAAIDGCPVLLQDGVSVEPVCTVRDVDLHTGNIDFTGTVHVTGEIHTGMTVKASGDIHIDGTIAGVMLIAGGDIVVAGGIIGTTEQAGEPLHRSTIACDGSCSANFVQNAHITAKKSILVRDFSMQSELSAGHQIIVGDGSRKGNLIGGTARATMLVKAQVIGAPARSNTIVIVGADKALYERLKGIAEAREAVLGKLSSVVKLLELAAGNSGRLPVKSIKAAELTRDSINSELADLGREESELNKEVAASKEAQVIAGKQFLEGVEVRFGLQRQSMVADRQGGIFKLDEGVLTFT